jgi:hypothetical protein
LENTPSHPLGVREKSANVIFRKNIQRGKRKRGNVKKKEERKEKEKMGSKRVK